MKDRNVTISFCIPTYNRAALLQECLLTLFNQIGQNVEVVIVDGGSTDNTCSIIERFIQEKYNIIYHRRSERLGVDIDILKSIELATGDYCWLLSDDDLLEQNSFKIISSIINDFKFSSGFSLDYQTYSSDMSFKVKTVPAYPGEIKNNKPILLDKNTAFSQLGQHLGFISSQIINRKYWLIISKSLDLRNYCNSWIIIYMIGKILELNNVWYFLPIKAIKYRSGNDSFLFSNGVVGRQKIAHDNYNFIVSELFNKNSSQYIKICNNLIRYRMSRSLAVIKSSNPSVDSQFQIFKIYIKNYWRFPILWIKVLPIFLFPNFFFILLKKCYFKLAKLST